MPATDLQNDWISRFLGVDLQQQHRAHTSKPFDVNLEELLSPEAPEETLSKTLPDDLKGATRANLQEIKKLEEYWKGTDEDNYELYLDRLKKNSQDIEDLYENSSKLLKELKNRRDSGPALAKYDEIFTPDFKQYLQDKRVASDQDFQRMSYRRQKFGAFDACKDAGQMLQAERHAIISNVVKDESEEDRTKILDTLASFPEKPETLWEQARMRALIELRFGIKFAGNSPLATGHQKGLDKLYDTLKLVPSKQMKSLGGKGVTIDYADEGFRGDYSRTSKTVAVAMPLSDHKQIQRPNSAGEPATVDWFKQVILHEVGHAVDDASSYMADHQATSDHGGWEATDIHKAVAAYAGALKAQLGATDGEISVGSGEQKVMWNFQTFIAFSIQRGPIAENQINIED